MGQTHNEITQNLAERLCWEVARRDDSRVARRLYRKQLVDGGFATEKARATKWRGLQRFGHAPRTSLQSVFTQKAGGCPKSQAVARVGSGAV
jgi:hypothetical protein